MTIRSWVEKTKVTPLDSFMAIIISSSPLPVFESRLAVGLVGQHDGRIGDDGPGHGPPAAAGPPESSAGRRWYFPARPTSSMDRHGPASPFFGVHALKQHDVFDVFHG